LPKNFERNGKSHATRIENAIALRGEFGVAALLLIVGVVPYKVIPAQVLVLSCQSMKSGDLVVIVLVVTASFKQEHLLTRLRQIPSQRTTTGA